MKIEIKETLDAGDDVLVVRGTVEGVTAKDEKGEAVPILIEARGWLSATTNHYDTTDYEDIPEPTKDDKHGRAHGHHLKKGAKPREMTPAEKREYCEALLAAAAPHPEKQPQAVTLF